MNKGTRALLIVVVVTALVITPLVLGGIYAGEYVAGRIGAPSGVLPIAFSTAGFVAGMAIIFRVIKIVVARTTKSAS